MKINQTCLKYALIFSFISLNQMACVEGRRTQVGTDTLSSHAGTSQGLEMNASDLSNFLRSPEQKHNITLALIKTFSERNELNNDIKELIFDKVGMMLWDGMHTMYRGVTNNDTPLSEYRAILDFIYAQNFNVDKVSCHCRQDRDGHCWGNTMLMTRISYGRTENPDSALILLRDFKANPFVLDCRDKKHALHFLLLKGHDIQQGIIEEVLKNQAIGEHIHDQTKYGDTALHIACARRDITNIKRLLQCGAKASLNLSNNLGKKPLDMLDMGKEERLKFLLLYLDNHTVDTPCSISSIAHRFSNLQVLLDYLKVPLDSKQKDYLSYLATIDDPIFDSEPLAIKEAIKKII